MQIYEWLWIKLACMQSDVSLTACCGPPAGIFARCLCSSSYRFFVGRHFFPVAVTFLTREEETLRELHRQIWKSMSHFLWCFSNQPPTTPRMPWQPLHLWLMTSAIVGPHACDLLIKFVFTPRELVGRAAVTHGTDVAPSQTEWSENARLLCTFGVNIMIHLWILLGSLFDLLLLISCCCLSLRI